MNKSFKKIIVLYNIQCILILMTIDDSCLVNIHNIDSLHEYIRIKIKVPEMFIYEFWY